MLERAVLPDLRARSGEPAVIASRVLHTWGESESGLNERLDDVIAAARRGGRPDDRLPRPRVGGARGAVDDAPADVAAAARRCSTSGRPSCAALLGPLVFGVDGQSMESVVLDLLRSQGLTLGPRRVADRRARRGPADGDPRGQRRVPRGASCPTPARSSTTCSRSRPGPVVNEAAAVQMAEGAQRVLGADVGLGLTGVAGPAEQDDVPVGTVCVAVALPTGSHATTLRLGTQREQVRQFAVISALDLLRRRLAMAARHLGSCVRLP